MRRSLLIALVGLGCGCATPPVDSGNDQPRMSAIERSASDRGVRVYWVNPPRKPEAGTKAGG